MAEFKMGHRFIGKSGLKVSELCLGTMTFGFKEGGPKQCSEEEAHAILDRFVEMGGNFIDTADIYQKGKSEEIIGNWLSKQQRDTLAIATKGCAPMGSHPNALGLSRVHLMQAVEDSLKRLQTSYIDLYQVHCWDDAVPVEETMSALNDLVTQGKVRYIGLSNHLGWQVQKVVEVCRNRGWHVPIALQQQYNLLVRQSELEPFRVCTNEGLGVLPWSPLKGGWLSGKIRRDTQLNTMDKGDRLVWSSQDGGKPDQANPSYDQIGNEKLWKLLDLMEEIGKKHGKGIPQVALRWLLEKKFVPSVIIGVKTIAQLESNMGASGGWSLSGEEMTQLDEASAYEVPYPYEMVFRANAIRQRPN